MSLSYSLFDITKNILIQAAPGMPADYWWITALTLCLLVSVSVIDVFTAIIPDAIIFWGLLLVTGTQGLFISWDVAAQHLRHGIIAGLIVWAVNYVWHKSFRHDALGMGDAKWTILAVACFGILPSLFAWGLGAILATIYIGLARINRGQVSQVTFAPFLMVALCTGIYWVRFYR